MTVCGLYVPAAAAPAPEEDSSTTRRAGYRRHGGAFRGRYSRSVVTTRALPTLPVCPSHQTAITVPVLREEVIGHDAHASPGQAQEGDAPGSGGEPFVLFEPGFATRRVIDSFFVTENIEPVIVMDTENVEIEGDGEDRGISIVPYQAVAREVADGQFFARASKATNSHRQTGWSYACANRVPRMVLEPGRPFEEIRGGLQFSPEASTPGA